MNVVATEPETDCAGLNDIHPGTAPRADSSDEEQGGAVSEYGE